jgi:two-component system, response regulator PdtaR
MCKKILIVEDDLKVAENYQQILESNGYQVVGLSTTYEEALDLFFENAPDLIVCDICLQSRKSGIDLVKQIQKVNEKTNVIFTTSFSDNNTISQALSFHPKSYLIKPFCLSQLLVTVMRIFENTQATKHRWSENVAENPTKREMEVIHLIAEGYTTKEIAKALSISFETVQTHRKNVLNKFKVQSSAELISMAHCNKWLS